MRHCFDPSCDALIKHTCMCIEVVPVQRFRVIGSATFAYPFLSFSVDRYYKCVLLMTGVNRLENYMLYTFLPCPFLCGKGHGQHDVIKLCMVVTDIGQIRAKLFSSWWTIGQAGTSKCTVVQ